MKECRLEGVGRKGNLLLSWGLFLVPLTVLLYVLMPPIAMGYLFTKMIHFTGSGALPMNILVFITGFLLSFKLFEKALRSYYGAKSSELVTLFFRGAMSSFSTLEIGEGEVLQRFDNRTVRVNLRKCKMLWIMSLVPLVVLRDGEGNSIAFLTLSFGKGGRGRFLKCIALATGIEEGELKFSYLRDFILKGMKYSKAVDLSRKFY